MIEKENLLPVDRRKFNSIIRKSGKQLVRAIEDIINISKFKLKWVSISKTNFSLNQLMDNLLMFFRNEMETLREKDISFDLSKGLVELLGREIGVSSVVGQGTTFQFTLPVSILGNVDTSESSEKPTLKKYNFSGKKILIAEDVIENYELLQILLKDAQPILFYAEDGEKAVEICNTNDSIDLILMDIRMPVMDGFEATREIRKFRPNLPIMAVTAYALAEDKVRCLEAGCNDIILKPIDKNKLLQGIKNYL